MITPEKELPAHTAALMRYLRGNNWQTARTLYDRGLFGWASLSDARREMRDAAEHSDGHVVSGQRGYKLTIRATPDEIEHARRRLNRQARLMMLRAANIREVGDHYESKRKA